MNILCTIGKTKLLEYFVIFVDNLNFNNFKLLLYIMWQDFGLQTGFKLLLYIFLRWGSADVAVVDFGSKPINKRKYKNVTTTYIYGLRR